MSLFGELDVASANENPYYKEDGTYLCQITGAEKKEANNASKSKGLVIKYTILEGDKKGLTIQEWKPLPDPWNIKGFESEEDMESKTNYDDEVASRAARSMSFLKSRLMDLGFPPEKMNTLDPKDFFEVPKVYVTIKNKNDRENVTSVELAEGTSSSVGSSDPFKG